MEKVVASEPFTWKPADERSPPLATCMINENIFERRYKTDQGVPLLPLLGFAQ